MLDEATRQIPQNRRFRPNADPAKDIRLEILTLCGPRLDANRQQEVEEAVTRYIIDNLSFVVIAAEDRTDRLALEKALIATVAQCPRCKPSSNWLGNFSPVGSIRTSGLWLKQHLNGETLSRDQLQWLSSRGPHNVRFSLDVRSQFHCSKKGSRALLRRVRPMFLRNMLRSLFAVVCSTRRLGKFPVPVWLPTRTIRGPL